MKKRVVAAMLNVMITILLISSGCAAQIHAEDLTKGIKAENVGVNVDIAGAESIEVTDFSAKLFQASLRQESGNVLISPISVMYALAMTANGAKGETLAQMEDVFGLDTAKLNAYLHVYMQSLESDEKCKLNIANSIWFKDSKNLSVETDFLQANANWYGAGVYKAPFDDSTLKDINTWVVDKTDGMIEDILNEISDEAVMYLVNAIAFDAEWQSIYKENEVRKDTFTAEDGSEQDVEFMYSEEHQYLEDENAVGFLKYYSNPQYAFAALLPNEGVNVNEYITSLTGESLNEILNHAQNVQVNAAMPKFQNEYEVNMNDILKDMGIEEAFESFDADFSGLGHSAEGNIYINRVLHKTYIAVDESGTKAGAATAVEMINESAMIEPQEIKTVHLDRPFVYMLLDCKSNLPIFIGIVTHIR